MFLFDLKLFFLNNPSVLFYKQRKKPRLRQVLCICKDKSFFLFKTQIHILHFCITSSILFGRVVTKTVGFLPLMYTEPVE